MKRLLTLVLLITLGAGGFLAYRHWFPSDEMRIQRLLDQAADSVSIRPDSSLLTKLGSVNRLLSLCTEDVAIILRGPGIQPKVIQGQDQLKEVMTAAQASEEDLEITLRDLVINLPRDSAQATAQFIAQARANSSPDSVYQEIRITLLRVGGDWKIQRVEPLQALGF